MGGVISFLDLRNALLFLLLVFLLVHINVLDIFHRLFYFLDMDIYLIEVLHNQIGNVTQNILIEVPDV